jgi:hypothetical protein
MKNISITKKWCDLAAWLRCGFFLATPLPLPRRFYIIMNSGGDSGT